MTSNISSSTVSLTPLQNTSQSASKQTPELSSKSPLVEIKPHASPSPSVPESGNGHMRSHQSTCIDILNKFTELATKVSDAIQRTNNIMNSSQNIS